MVCDDKYQNTLTKTIFTAGLAVGAMLIGVLADRYVSHDLAVSK